MHDNTNTRIRTEQTVADHYSRENPAERVYGGLREAGIDIDALEVDNLAPVDEFHIRGREATIEIAGLVELGPEHHVLDVGCGIGGSARFLAGTYGCRVTGIDLTAEYCELGNTLSERVGLSSLTQFQQASALDLPFADNSFDIVWTEHAQMNIADKRRFYAEMVRVLRPGGAIVFHDIFAGPTPGLTYPTPWATEAESSFLLPVPELETVLGELGLSFQVWRDCTELSTTWFCAVRDRIAANGPPPVGVHLLMGDRAFEKIANTAAGLEAGALATIQAVLRKPNA